MQVPETENGCVQLSVFSVMIKAVYFFKDEVR